MNDNTPHIRSILDKTGSVCLAQMEGVALQNRIDKKYVLHRDRLPAILDGIIDRYFVLGIDDNNIFTYKTVYFDTPGLQFYKDHHNGLNNRVKVRCRQYVESNDTFFEIKRKYRGYRTDKYRKNIAGLMTDLGHDEYKEIRERYKKHVIDQLHVTLHSFFHRVTLVSKTFTERVTIDFDLGFRGKDREALVNDIVIIEVKQGKYDEQSPVVQALKRERIYPAGISKYTYGLLLVGNDIKYNAFKQVLHKVNKIQTADGAHR